MGLASVVPGRYTANIKDWGIQENEHLDGALEVWIAFDFKDQAGGLQSITWKGLVLRKDGERNAKTFKTLETAGLKDDDMIRFMEDANALNMQEQLDITIEDQVVGDKVYKNVEWVNKVGGGQRNKPTGEAAQDIKTKLARMGLGKVGPKTTAKPKNYAPGANEPNFDDTSDIPF